MDLALVLNFIGVDVIAAGLVALVTLWILKHLWSMPPVQAAQAMYAGGRDLVQTAKSQPIPVIVVFILAGACIGTIFDVVADELLDSCKTIRSPLLAPVPELGELFRPDRWRPFDEEDLLKAQAIDIVRTELLGSRKARKLLREHLKGAHLHCTRGITHSHPPVRGFIAQARAAVRRGGGDRVNGHLDVQVSAIRLLSVIILASVLLTVTWGMRFLVWFADLSRQLVRRRTVTAGDAGQVLMCVVIVMTAWLTMGALVRVWSERSMDYYTDVIWAYLEQLHESQAGAPS